MKIHVEITRPENVIYFKLPAGTRISMDIEDYLQGVVPAEIGISHIEACRAQSIASRTFAVRQMKNKGYLRDTSADQAYNIARADASKYPAAIAAIQDTAGQILTYKGVVLLGCFYGASNGGMTRTYKN